MPTTSATADQLLPLRTRSDVLAVATKVGGASRWMVKDPITLEHYDLGEVEYALLELLTDRQSLRQLQDHLQRRFAPQVFRREEVWRHVARLHEVGLLVGELRGQGQALGEQATRHDREQLRWSWTQLLAIRLPAWNPDRQLDALHRIVKPLFHPLAVTFAAALVLAALGLVVTCFEQVVARLPSLAELVAVDNWPWLLLTVVIVKVLHELGHGLAAKHFGAEVPEMGVMLLIFVPCLYCDVSDMWRIASKLKRMIVSAAGMAVELLVASVATFVWWFSEPGLLQLLALNTIVVASVGTLLVNANPLFRFDGYYLLSDLTDTPNLWQRSRTAVRERLGRLVFSSDRAGTNHSRCEPVWMAMYGVASSVYMATVLFGVFWMLLTALAPARMEAVAYLFGGFVLASVTAGSARQAHATLSNPIKRREFDTRKSTLVAVCFAGLLAGVWCWPVTDWVVAPMTVVPADAERIVATQPGRLTFVAHEGSQLQPNEPLAQLSNADLDQQLSRLAGELRLAEVELAGLQTQRSINADANDQLPTAQSRVDDLRRQLDDLHEEANRLTLRAASGGTVLPPPRHEPDNQEGKLPAWAGSPLDPHNIGCWIEPGTVMADRGQSRPRPNLGRHRRNRRGTHSPRSAGARATGCVRWQGD